MFYTSWPKAAALLPEAVQDPGQPRAMVTDNLRSTVLLWQNLRRGRASLAQESENSGCSVAQALPTTRKGHEPVQIARLGTAFPVGLRPDCRVFPQMLRVSAYKCDLTA